MDNINQYLQQTLKESQDAILIADREGIIRYWNMGAERILGYSAAEAIGQSLNLFIPEKLQGRHWEGYHRVMAGAETKYKTSLLSSPGICKDGSQVSLEFSMVLLHDADGTMQGCASIMRDVSERWRKEKELKQRLAACETSQKP
ncbi:MAG: PAS domain S-box protein [Trichlorobacter sp.]|uniref:PAS domain-containing protein n=1 Tax=Trichlorobacter sp. TaxID=2911007 RepID=UPI00255F031E|nr:PAS domain S-box protein [Trichlorobacter sp.]MDK9717156.1 PAS domain S-box protein [Trichlorobacter sp.]